MNPRDMSLTLVKRPELRKKVKEWESKKLLQEGEEH